MVDLRDDMQVRKPSRDRYQHRGNRRVSYGFQ
jgi:hypothetical protein